MTQVDMFNQKTPKKPRNTPEAQLQSKVLQLAQTLGWRRHAERPAPTRSGGYATHIQGEKGWPDLVLVHPRKKRIVFIELKSDKGRVFAEQQAWLDALEACGLDVYVFRPRDFDRIVEVLHA